MIQLASGNIPCKKIFMKMKPSVEIFCERGLLSWQLIALLIVSAVPLLELPAEAQEVCGSSNSPSYGDRASATRRTVELPDIGVAVAIPENYRTMQMQNGAVRILHPSAFDMLQCLARGGRGGHGIYSETIKLVEDDLTMNLREQATSLGGYNQGPDGRKMPTASQVIPYEKGGLSGYIVASEYGYGASFLGAIAGRDSLVEVSAGCDCQVGIDAITDLLPHITVLN